MLPPLDPNTSAPVYRNEVANPDHLKILKLGVGEWNAWRRKNPAVIPDLAAADLSGEYLGDALLSGAKLNGANLIGADLNLAHLKEANLSWANLSWANLFHANVNCADLNEAYLDWADLTDANLGGANLIGASLRLARIDRTILTKADLERAIVGSTVFADLDLSEVKGLDHLIHIAPSTIGIDTLYKSKSKIPESFLRGCGVPDNLIRYLPSLTGQAIQFYSCFISYSTKDQEFADRLYADLQSQGVRCWFAPHDVRAGRKLHEQIDEAIRLYDKLLLILSPHSMESEWVKTEIAKARKREQREKRKMLFPITLVGFDAVRAWKCFDADTGKDSAREIREFYVPDFSNWENDHAAYKRELDRLIKDLENPDTAQPRKKRHNKSQAPPRV